MFFPADTTRKAAAGECTGWAWPANYCDLFYRRRVRSGHASSHDAMHGLEFGMVSIRRPGGQPVHSAMVMHHAAAVLDTETQSEPSFVKEVGCHEAQGYFYSKPLPAPMLREWPDGAA
jgi:hypothetical protein